MKDFKTALADNDIEALRKINKVDIHNHAIMSGTRKYLLDHDINLSKEKITDFPSFINFCRTYIRPIQLEEKGLRLLLEGNFNNCIETGVIHVTPSIDYKSCINTFNSNVEEFVSFLKSFSYDNLTIHWDIAISRDSYIEEHKKLITDLINTKFFSGIDLVSTENKKPNNTFKEIYELAESLNMITKVHAGEQLGADYIYDCITDLNPKQIQHGIHIIEDEKVMKLAKEKGIIFNICPTSNVILGNAKSIKDHPIKKMVEYGLNVTIGTDDILLFESDINSEYLKLYNEKTLTANELEKIRLFGLSLFENEN